MRSKSSITTTQSMMYPQSDFDPTQRSVHSGRRHESDSESAREVKDASLINLAWLLRLRWVSMAAQTATIVAVMQVSSLALPWRPLGFILGIQLVSNVFCLLWARAARQISEWMLALLMAMDLALLTWLFHVTGGPMNPFSVLYLVPIALAAVVLKPRWTWALVIWSFAGFGSLFAFQGSSSGHHLSNHDPHFMAHLRGMWLAFGVAAIFIVYFVQRATRALAAREAELTAARMQTARNEKLASLATLAAGAAHELSTPLATIAVVAKELERQLEVRPQGETAIADARLIRAQVERCRKILVQMAADAEETAESKEPVRLSRLLDGVLDGLPGQDRVQVQIAEDDGARWLDVPTRAISFSLRAVVENALQASPAGTPVRMQVDRAGGYWRIEVRDQGTGASPAILNRAGEPFFTTKPPGQGLGLGLFLTRAVLERLGGQLELSSTPGVGTSAVLLLPEQVEVRATNHLIAARTSHMGASE